MADLAHEYHFQPSELWQMDVDELLFWHEELVRINEKMKQRIKRSR